MTAFTTDTLNTYGGALNNASAVVDSTTDLDASQGNKWAAACAGMTHTAFRAWVHMTLNGASAPVLVAHDAIWGNSLAVAPALAYLSTGVWTITWGATQSDEIPSTAPGYTGPLPINLRGGSGNVRVVATAYLPHVVPTSANVVQFIMYSTTGALANPVGNLDVDVFVF
jgi:hypothetical protein